MMNSNSITSKRENCNGINPINLFFRVEIWDLGLERRWIIWAWAMGIQLSSSWGNRPIVPLLLYIWLAGHSTSRGILYFKAPEVSLSQKKTPEVYLSRGSHCCKKKKTPRFRHTSQDLRVLSTIQDPHCRNFLLYCWSCWCGVTASSFSVTEIFTFTHR